MNTRTLAKFLKCIRLSNLNLASSQIHTTSKLNGSQYYPINDDVFGLNEEHKQLRQTVFNFFQKELAPNAQEIDKSNNFKDMRVCDQLLDF